jgi:BirA family biotin operon repressor/biotin-[acetyl-CoA-carboxylase] ligase
VGQVTRAALDGDRLRAAAAPRWSRVEIVAETASTNADLLATAGAPDRTALVAEHQTSGRGRLDRLWTSPPRAGLTFSVLLRPGVPVPRWGWLPLLTGVALTEAVAATTGIATALKWPNDLLARPGGGKLAGVLAQTGGEADSVVIGIGLNVDTARSELPVDTATSLALAGAGTVDRTELLAAILNRLDARAAQWSDYRGDAAACGLAAAYRDACDTLGRSIRVDVSDSSVVEGEAVGIDDDGRLTVRTRAGDVTIGAGDVTHLRPS